VADPLDDLEAWLKERRQQAAVEQQSQATGERFDRLESLVEGIGKTLEGLQHPAPQPADSPSPPGAPSRPGEGEGEPPPGEEPEPELPVEKVTRKKVPQMWSGDDEPDIVHYLDAETGEEKTRKGRKRNKVAVYDVEQVEPEPEPAPEPAPEEPAA
jgi:hypothetical protein